jgi:hypothetical protein
MLKQTQEYLGSGFQAIPDTLREQFQEATKYAFAIGIGRMFALVILLCIICAAFVWLGMRAKTQGNRVRSTNA